MEPKKIYVNNENEATILCDSCGKSRTAKVTNYLHLTKPVKIKCGCGHHFWAEFETRQTHRRKVTLHGRYSVRGINRERMYIENISAGGLAFKTSRKNIKKGETLKVEFELDNSARSAVSENAIVKFIDGGHVGVEFTNPCENTRKKLGFYLL